MDNQSDYSLGEDLQFQGNLDDALLLYDGLISKNPRDVHCLREKAFCLLRCDRIMEARETLDILKSVSEPSTIDFKTQFIEIKAIIRGDPDDDGSQHSSAAAAATVKKTRALHKFAHLLNDEVRVIGSSDAWRLLVTGILAHLMLNKLKASVELHEASYAVMPAKSRSHVALEIANLYHDLYLIEEESELQAQLAISQQDCLAAAIAWFEKVAQDNPTETRGHLILSQIYLNQSDFNRSAAECEKALQLSETIKPIALLQKATIALKQNSDLKQALSLMSEAHAIIVARQRMLLQSQDIDENNIIAASYEDRLKQEQETVSSENQLTQVKLSTESPAAAAESTEQMKKRKNQTQALDSAVGLVLYQARNLSERGYIGEAVQILEDCLKDNSENAAIYLELGHTYFLTGSADDIPKSIDFYLKCYEVDSEFKDPAAAIALGAYYLEKVSEIQENQAEEQLLLPEYDRDEQSDSKDEGNGDDDDSEENVDLAKKEKLKSAGDSDEAVKKNFEAEITEACTNALIHFTKALDLDTKKKCKKVHKSIATCYRLLNKFSMAAHSYEKELADDEDDIDTLIEYASLLREMKNKKKGVAIIEKILFLDQHNEEAYETLCEFLDENFDRIVSVLKRVFDRGDKSLDNIAQLIARTLVKFDKRQLFKQPEKWIEVALSLNSKNPDTHFTQGLLFLEKDTFQNALDWFAKCLAIDPDHEECLETMLDTIQSHFDELDQSDIKEALEAMRANDEEWLKEQLHHPQNSRILALVEFDRDQDHEGGSDEDEGESESESSAEEQERE